MKLLLIFILFLSLVKTMRFSVYPIVKSRNKMIHVSISGCIYKPGVYDVEVYSTLEELLSKADLKDNCDTSMYNLSLPLKDGDDIYIPTLTEETEIKISLNSSTVQELCLLPGIGEKTAERIVEYRNENGFFQNIEDIQYVSGIGEAKFQKIKDLICL